MAKLRIEIDNDLCNGDGLCVDNCPGKGLGLKEGKAVVVDGERCGECYYCESICPTGAIHVYKEE
ncbi:MAG: 4Fe-4S binding protein [Desulfomonile tiedjei]|uniref:4Fe-4S binding protein n=1 Tax=Desulfomonile tiedjei TaxID=2358 RepID=A0A9D6Z3F6_9BACT|nr:4Fe-4S binding protein [Desulfomonile tiedjei]